jgi:hypothetical protein
MQGAGKALSVVANLFKHRGLERHRRHHAGRIAGVDARLFDVFHDPGDDHVVAIGDSVHVHLRGVLEELINQNGALGVVQASQLRRLRHVLFHCLQIVGNHHRPATQYVTWPNQHRQANIRSHGDGLLGLECGATSRLRDIQLRQ